VKRETRRVVRGTHCAIRSVQIVNRQSSIVNYMNLLIKAAEIHTPVAIKRKKLLELFACTAGAFGCEAPPTGGLSYEELLDAYARFTAAQAGRAVRRGEGVIASDFCEAISASQGRDEIASSQTPLLAMTRGQGRDEIASSQTPLLAMTGAAPDVVETRRRLYEGAYRMGEELRRAFRVTNTADAMAAARVLYRGLGIDLQATPGGEIIIRRCFFSQYYSSPVCGVIAALDEGLFAGLSGGGQLAFTQRITKGNSHCEAHFRQSEHSA
jgi:hypothetical protein